MKREGLEAEVGSAGKFGQARDMAEWIRVNSARLGLWAGWL